jgi:hypothetical protein
MLQVIPAIMPPPIGTKIGSDLVLLFDQCTVFEYKDLIGQLDACIVGVEKTLQLFKCVFSNMPPAAA